MSVADEVPAGQGITPGTDPTAAPDAAPEAVADATTESDDGATGSPDPSNTPIGQLVADLAPDDDVLHQIQALQAPDATP